MERLKDSQKHKSTTSPPTCNSSFSFPNRKSKLHIPGNLRSYNKSELGGISESLAAKYLKKKGYKILARRFRTRFGEVDILACRQETVWFIEVRSTRIPKRKSESMNTRTNSIRRGSRRTVNNRSLEKKVLTVSKYGSTSSCTWINDTDLVKRCGITKYCQKKDSDRIARRKAGRYKPRGKESGVHNHQSTESKSNTRSGQAGYVRPVTSIGTRKLYHIRRVGTYFMLTHGLADHDCGILVVEICWYNSRRARLRCNVVE